MDRRRKEQRVLARDFILHEKIQTTKARAKLTQAVVEKLITRGKKGGLQSLRILRRDLPLNAVKKINEVFAPRYQNRAGGYTRVIHVGKFRDGTAKVQMEFVK